MANKFQKKAKLIGKVIHNEKYIELEFELNEAFSCEVNAGQYVSIKVGEPKVLRSYSICSDPSCQDKFKLMVDVTPQGVGTTFLTSLNLGDEVEVLGPLGKFVLSDDITTKNVVLVGTGSGVAPLVSMLHDLVLHKKTSQQIILLWGERFAKNLIFQEQLSKLIDGKDNIKLVNVVSRPEDGDQNYHGRVTDYIKNEALPENAEYYLCGRKEMINDVTQLLLEKGVSKEVIFHEKFD